MKGTLHKDQFTFSIIARSVLLRMEKSQKKVVEKLEKHILCSVTFFKKKNSSVYEICGKIL